MPDRGSAQTVKKGRSHILNPLLQLLVSIFSHLDYNNLIISDGISNNCECEQMSVFKQNNSWVYKAQGDSNNAIFDYGDGKP